MKVKCIKTSIDKPLLGSINYDVHDYLEIGDSFFVYGIRFLESDIYVYIYNGNHLFEAPIKLFEVTNNLTPNWKIKIWETGEITLWPELFYTSDFLENFGERETRERRLFVDLQALIEKQGA